MFVGERPRHQFFDTTKELANFILQQDAAGMTVYHACASFKTKSRKQANVFGIASFWADIDTRKGKPDAPYADPQDAAEAVVRFCKSTGMPLPVFVGSGYGVHVYWPLREPLLEDVWRTNAKRLAQLFAMHGLKVDTTRTQDSASILRPPGTHNRKNGGCALVECGPLVGPYQLEDLPLGELEGAVHGGHERAVIAGRILGGQHIPPSWSEALEARLRSALACIPADNRETWLHVGMALHWVGWARAFQIWDEWSCTAPDKYDEAEQQGTWESFDRERDRPVTIGTIFHMAMGRGWTDQAATTEEMADGREPTQREKLIVIGLDADLWHDKDGNVFATVNVDDHKESCAIGSRAFRNWLTRTYGERYPMKVGGKTCPSAPSTQVLNEAINALSAKAASGAEHQAAVRLGELSGLIYLDLGTPEWNAVEVSATGWRVVPFAPVRFIRPAGLRPLATPIAGGLVSELRDFLNVGSNADFVLIVSWLISCLRPNGPYPVLVINGEHGSGKSVACRILRHLIDANGAELRNAPRDERDLMLAARNSWIVALDNLSYVRNDLSDCICRIATKGAFATRALYSNDEEFLMEVCRPVLLNGIPPLASRADLSDRAIVCVLPTMADATRRTEEEIWSAFEDAAPRLLGALLDGVSGVMRMYASVRLQHTYRMMDFAKWSEAFCQALGCQPGTFETAYRQNRSSATDEAIDADPVAGAVIDLLNNKQEFTGTATELLTQLECHVLPTQRDRRWPKDATRLSNHLRRLSPLLRPRGIEIYFDRSADAARKRLIVIKRVA